MLPVCSLWAAEAACFSGDHFAWRYFSHILGSNSGGPGSCDPRCWREGLAKAWGFEVKGHILQIPAGGWKQRKAPPSLISALAGSWGTGQTAEVGREVGVTSRDGPPLPQTALE